ncbi:zinc knuckle [Trichuris suis]|nr:zinc knuckle [Trichuris suis]
MESLKIVMDDASIVGKAVQCLPPQFDNFRESWRLSAPRFAKLTDLTSQLLACESDQVSRSMQTQISTGEALVGRKVGSPSKNVNNKSKYKDLVCWNCKKKGHTRSDCRSNKWVSSRPRDSEGKQTSRGGFVVRNVDIHQERNDGWIADSGAFKHITRNRHWFSTFKDTEPCGVRVGNDKLLYAVGVGTIEVEVYDGMSWTPSTLNNVLYVPEFGSSCLFSLALQPPVGTRLQLELRWIYDPQKRRVEEASDVKFNESFAKRMVLVSGEEEPWSQTDEKDDTKSYLDDTSAEQNNVELERGLSMPPGGKVKEKFTKPFTMQLRPRPPRNMPAMLAEGDPQSIEEALRRPDADKWEEAMHEEIKALHKNNTWVLTNLPPGRKSVQWKWVFKTKLNPNGGPWRYKSRLVAKGFSQRAQIDYFETYDSPV